MGSDVEALTRSFRSRIVVLGLVILAGLAAALWTGTRARGIGEPEDRRRVLIVTSGAGGMDYLALFQPTGFVVEVGEYDAWLEAATLADPDSEAEGVAAILELADRRGDAIVVFERGPESELGELAGLAELELEPSLADLERLDERNYLALSVGDYAFPHRVSVDRLGEDPRIRLPGYGALEAVFAQPLVSARAEPERPTVAELQFEDAIALGVQMYERPPGFAATVALTEASIAADLDDGSGARALIPTLETGTALPTPDGGLVVFHHELVIYSDNARTLELEAADAMQIGWIGPEAIASGELDREGANVGSILEPCPTLAGGALSMAGVPRFDAAADGGAIGLAGGGDSGEGTMTVWRKTAAPGCGWVARGELEPAGALVLAPGQAGASPGTSVAASAVATDDGAQIQIWTLPVGEPGEGEGEGEREGEGEGESEGESEGVASSEDEGPDGSASGLLRPTVILEQSHRRMAAPTFLDDRYLAVASERMLREDDEAREPRITVLDRERPGVYLNVPIEFFAPGRRVEELVALAPAHVAGASELGAGLGPEVGPTLLVVARSPLGELELLRVSIAGAAWAEFVAASAEPGGELGMVSLIPEQVTADRLATADRMFGLSVGPGAIVYATGAGPRPGVLVHLDLETGEERRLTDNQVRDYLPRFAADGSYLSFVSLLQVHISATPFSVPRLLKL